MSLRSRSRRAVEYWPWSVPPAVDHLICHTYAGAVQVRTVATTEYAEVQYDLSGHGHALVQPVTSAQPIVVPDVQHGRPVLRYDGVDDTMSVGIVGLSLPVTVACAFRVRVKVGGKRIVANAVNAAEWLAESATTGMAAFFGPPSVLYLTDVGRWTLGYACVDASGAVSIGDQDGVAGGTTGVTNLPNGLRQASQDGVSAFSSCDIGEMLAWDKCLDVSEVEQVVDYFSARWLP